ncbi:hypothetical protein AB0451_39450 [Streptomyces sp. NPDC052000]
MAYKSTHKAAPQAGASASDGAWHPSVKYLLVLLIAELIVFAALRSLLPN